MNSEAALMTRWDQIAVESAEQDMKALSSSL